jgi:hypothetical protein
MLTPACRTSVNERIDELKIPQAQKLIACRIPGMWTSRRMLNPIVRLVKGRYIVHMRSRLADFALVGLRVTKASSVVVG